MQEATNSQAVLPRSAWAMGICQEGIRSYNANSGDQSQSIMGDIEPIAKGKQRKK
jgi:hypothetical protein